MMSLHDGLLRTPRRILHNPSLNIPMAVQDWPGTCSSVGGGTDRQRGSLVIDLPCVLTFALWVLLR